MTRMEAELHMTALSYPRDPRNPRFLCLVVLFTGAWCALSAEPQTGPETEKRFPPLVVPAGFMATLFACDPLIEYPSAIAIGPKDKPGSAFVAIDYMTGLGTEIVRRDEIRLIEDTDADGYADKATVYAGEFNSIMGLAFHAGTVYVMHSPFLTSLRDTDGDGRADERRDLLTGLGLPPEENPVRLHCANGVTVGHDGWLYLALGDHGCDVPRPEGGRLVHEGGAILRCRSDGRELHVFASGLRNIYDVALDDELNVFVRDNENDGGDYKLRLCHSFFGADHGYPYLYYERPHEALPPLGDLGLGSSAGGVCYLETQFPAEYRGSLLFCEWGRSVVRSHPVKDLVGFKPLTESQFAAGADNDPYGFKPTDIVVERDGSLLVADWCDGQRPKRGRGRIYRITHQPDAPAREPHQPAAQARDDAPGKLISQLDSESYHQRVDAQDAIAARGVLGVKSILDALAEPGRLQPHARMHAVWILAGSREAAARQKLWDLAASDVDPRVQTQAIRAIADDPAADRETAVQLAALAKGNHLVLFEIVVAAGRLGWHDSPQWLHETLRLAQPGKLNPTAAHAFQQALRRSGNWPAVFKLLDLPDSGLRSVAVNALACQWSADVADGLIERLNDHRAARRIEYADLLTRIHRQPGPWTYWGYRPPPRPANSVAWERTAAIEEALHRLLADSDRSVRLAVLRQMQREQVPVKLESLVTWLANEQAAEPVAAILAALRDQRLDQTREALASVLADRRHQGANRALALELLDRDARSPLAGEAILPLLGDDSTAVRIAAANTAGKRQLRAAADPLLKLAADSDSQVRRAGLTALRLLKEPRAVPLAAGALTDRTTQAAALACLAELGGPEHAAAVVELASKDPNDTVVIQSVSALATWSDKDPALSDAVARLQGRSGLLVRWKAAGPFAENQADRIREEQSKPLENSAPWRTVLAQPLEARVPLKGDSAGVWIAYADCLAAEAGDVQFLASASGKYQVWLNGKSIYRREEPRTYQPDSDRFDAALSADANRLVVQLTSAADAAQFHMRFRRKSAAADLEKLMQAALSRRGDPARGRAVFLDAKAQCSKCHRVENAGERIGPELTGIGSRFSKIHIVESILEPSRTVTPGFQTLTVRLTDGRVLTGVRVAETATALTLADQQGTKHELSKAEIDAQQPQAKSTMPDNVAQQLTVEQFVDLVAFLTAQKSPAP